MKTFYSILSLNINPEIDERISVGMLMMCGESVFYHYSRNKLSFIQKLVDKTTYTAAHDYLRLVERSVKNKETIDLPKDVLDLKPENKYDNILSEPYITYLSRYNNNLISFSKPKFLEVEANETVFRKLFTRLIDETAFEIHEKEKKQIDLFKKQFFLKAKPYFNIEQEIGPEDFNGLLTPVKLDLLGKNETEVFVQSIDFEKPVHSIELNVGSLLQIQRALPKSKKYILSYEPDKKIELNHRIWNILRHTSDFDYIDISEADRITEYAETHGVKPLFE